MKTYAVENDMEVDLGRLTAQPMDTEAYVQAHRSLVIPCHDVFAGYNGGILLVRRLSFPAGGILWPLGGRVSRGMDMGASLKEKVQNESGLELEDITELGHARTFFSTDPFGHGRGVDTINFVYFAKARGSLNLDRLHAEPTVVLPGEYEQKHRGRLHPYVRDFMELALPFLNK